MGTVKRLMILCLLLATTTEASTYTDEASTTGAPTTTASTDAPTETPTVTPTVTPTETTTETPTVTPTETTTGTPTVTPTVTPTETTTETPTVTPTETTTVTPTESTTGTPTETPTESTSGTPIETSTGTPTETTTGTPTETTTGTPTETTAGTPTTPTSTTKTTTTTTTRPTSAQGHCASNPCPQDSTCEERVDGFTCICQPGLIYDRNSCFEAKSFPSDLQLPKLEFKKEMEKRESEEFNSTSHQIVEALQESLGTQTGYLRSTVLQLSAQSTRAVGVSADVVNFFNSASPATEDTVNTAVQKAISSNNSILSGGAISFKSLCSVNYCDNTTTKCNSANGRATCSCKEEYVLSNRMTRACIACPSGEKAVNSETCERCSFGLSGFNCNEPYLLSVVVVSCILGTLSVCSLIAVIVMSSRKPKEITGNIDEIKMEFSKPAGIPKIPRANPNAGWQASNLDASDSGSRSALVTRDHSEWTSNGLSRPNMQMDSYGDYGETRNYSSQFPSRSAYGAVSNVSRANRNPYYDPDEGRY